MDAISYAKASSAYKLASTANARLADKVSKEGSSILVPVGTTATRPVLSAGESALRYNRDAGGLEEWTGTEWKNVSTVDHVSKTSGTGASGTTDVYTVWGDVAETVNLGTFNIYNGQDGTGAINDATITTTTFWSSKKINDEILAMSIALG